MTNEEAIKEIQDASDYEVRHGDIEHHYEDIMRRVEAFEQAVNALQKHKAWIPVSERLPEMSGLYLVNIGDLVTTMGFDGHHFRRGRLTYDVVAWMPLPEPYGEREEN